jgi:hypothetical protein
MTRMRLPQPGAGTLLALALSVAAIVPGATPNQAVTPASNSPSSIVFVQAPIVAAGNAVDRFPKGSRLVLLNPAIAPRKVIPLTRGFFAARDPQVSFDGSRILFSARRTRGARWQIWEMNVDGTAKRQVTQCSGDCLGSAYLAHGQLVYTQVEGQGPRANSQVFIAQLDGSESRPITFGPGDFRVETVLHDGRILVSASSPLRAGQDVAGSRQLYTVRLDGTALQTFRCDHRDRAVREQATELNDGSLVFVKARGGDELGGQLAEIRRGALHNSVLTRPQGIYLSPHASGSESLIVAREDTSAHGGAAKFDLYAFDSASGEFGDRIYEDPKLSSIQAVPVAPRSIPRWFWSIVKPEAKAGYFICLNSYLSSDAPHGRMETPIAQVRVLTLDPQSDHERALGTTPVEKDGSFYIAVPPDRPIRFELLNAEGRVIRAQRSWIWTRPGEDAACVGCHENKAEAPPNRWPLTLRRLDTPIYLGVEPVTQSAH